MNNISDLNVLPRRPDLYVIGAGPGDPELITLKALRVLEKARVILYDNLANRQLLDLAPSDCERIYVGKQPYGEYTPQEKIHELISYYAFSKGSVVRLKGGDPFIFGRGFEEVLFARSCGIETHYIPGISSMQAFGFEDIPLTHRVVSDGVWVITGTKKDGSLSADLKLAIQSSATIVIYMGMKKLRFIADVFTGEGKGDTPAAILMHASLPWQKMVKGPVRELPELSERDKLSYPAIIIIGEVAGIQF